jgi:hypothetical protein
MVFITKRHLRQHTTRILMLVSPKIFIVIFRRKGRDI